MSMTTVILSLHAAASRAADQVSEARNSRAVLWWSRTVMAPETIVDASAGSSVSGPM